MANTHKRGSEKNKFCANPIRKECNCGNDYIGICNPNWNDSYLFSAKVTRKKGIIFYPKKYEAHHILCVASVSVYIVGNMDIDQVVRETIWCINDTKNMIALPVWGHTVNHYCTVTLGGGSPDEKMPEAPPFADLPQHNWDHNGKGRYKEEVDNALMDLAKEVKESGHEFDDNGLSTTLEELSDEFRQLLLDRGKRNKGTHKSWELGSKNELSNWYEDFSMASKGFLSKKRFPGNLFNKKVAKQIKKLVEGLSGGIV